jgi:hypothetical protein
MPNVTFTKDDGQPLNIPAKCVTSIWQSAESLIGAEPEKRSFVHLSFMGATSYYIRETAKEAFDKVQDAMPKKAIKLRPDRGDLLPVNDVAFAAKGAIIGYEVKSEGDLAVFFNRHDGQEVHFVVQNTDETVRAVEAAIIAGD